MHKIFRLLAAAGLLATGAAFAQVPGEFEMEMWRSATRLDTPSAYEAYLKAFPQGAFAPMARAAMAKGSASAAPAAPAATPATPPAPSALQPYQGNANSGATELPVGARLNGPGVVTVGSTGARRQLVIPPGEWILLAAEDHRTPGRVQHSLATLAFGQFSGAELRSLLVATFNRRPISAPTNATGMSQEAGLIPTWTSANACEAATRNDVVQEVKQGWTLRTCLVLRPAGDWRSAFPDAPPLLDALDTTLSALRAQVGAFAWRSEVHITDKRYGHLGLTRLDTAEVGPAAARAGWLRRWAERSNEGYTREFDLSDLQPGQAAPAKGLDLPA